MKILIWDRARRVINEIGQLLPVERIASVESYEDFIKHAQAHGFDCVVADLSVYNGSVASFVENIKQHQPSGGLILICSATSLEEKVEALRAGADDFLSIPFEMTELAARIFALVRRVRAMTHSDLSYKEIRISLDGKLVFINERELSLTRKELELLLYFIQHKNSVVSKENLVSFLSGNSQQAAGNMDILYAHIKNLKKKLVGAGCRPYLKTVYGIGYKWEGV